MWDATAQAAEMRQRDTMLRETHAVVAGRLVGALQVAAKGPKVKGALRIGLRSPDCAQAAQERLRSLQARASRACL